MNGELYDMCMIALAAGKAWKENSEFKLEGAPYILSRRFVFSEGFGCTENAESWFKTCSKRGAYSIKLMVPLHAKNRFYLGFVNQTGAYLILFRKERGASILRSSWSFDQKRKGWNVLYREEEWASTPIGLPLFQDETADFKAVLKETEDLAHDIQEPFFEARFHDSIEILEGRKNPERKMFPNVPEPYGRILEAASYADVFGAMASWNDSPPYEAKKIGRGNDYERLSEELLKQIRLGILYAVNSCTG